MSTAGQRGAVHGNSNNNSNHDHNSTSPQGQETPRADASSPSSSSRVLRSTTERRRRTNLFSAFYPLLSRNSNASSSGGSSPSAVSGASSSSNRANRGNNSNMSRGAPNQTNNSVSNGDSLYNNNRTVLRSAVQTASTSSSPSSPSLPSNSRIPRGLTRVHQRMHDEVSLRSTRSTSSRTSSVRGVASASSSDSTPSQQHAEDYRRQMEVDLDSIGQRSHPSHHSYPPCPQHPSPSSSSTSSSTAAASRLQPPSSALADSSGSDVGNSSTDHMMLHMEPAGMSSNTTLRPTTRYRTRASHAAMSPAPISTSNFGSSSISTTGATGIPEPSSASTTSSISDASSAPVTFSRFSLGLPNPRGGTSISSSLLPIRPDSDDEEQDMLLDPTIDHQPMAIDDAETASSVAVSMADQHQHRYAPRRRDLNPPSELIAEIIHSQFAHPPPHTTSDSRPLSSASSASSSLVATAPTTTPGGVSSSNSSITSENRPTVDSYLTTRSRSAQLAARGDSSNPAGHSMLESESNTTSSSHPYTSSRAYTYGEGSSTSFSGRRPALGATESSSSTGGLRRRATEPTATESSGFRPDLGAILDRSTSRSASSSNNTSSSLGATTQERPTLSSSPSTSSSTSATSSTDAASRAAARERFRLVQNQLPLFSRIIAHMTGSRANATTNRSGSSVGSGTETDAASTPSESAPGTASSTTLAGPSSSSSATDALNSSDSQSSSAAADVPETAAPPRPRRQYHPSLRVIQLGSSLSSGSSGTGENGENGEGGSTNAREDHGETIIVVLNAFGPLTRHRGSEEGEDATGTAASEDGQQDTTNAGGESSNARPRGRPQWLVVTMSSAYLGSVLAGASLNLDSEGGLNYDALWEFANLIGPARPVTTTQEAINRAGFHVGRYEGAIPGMRDFATLGDATKCLVCMCEYEEGEDLRALGCKHGFHQECIDKWLTTGANKCPICRAAAVVPNEETPATVEE
ncbi:hypothetical protein BGW42_004118 [Actinomortierella wolfii]|nr:hypothetical protein BGW42_004118 [Actinomortierella wolfii]